MLLVITTVFLLLYTLLIFYYFYYWLNVKEFSITDNSTICVSVIIAARNEEKHLLWLLKALERQTYSKEVFEIIVVDDFSTDNTQTVVQDVLNFRFHMILRNVYAAQSVKKKPIVTDVKEANGELG